MVGVTRVLLVEDDYEARGAMADVLRDAGYEVAEAAAGRAALQLAASERPDIVLLDLLLPDRPGPMLVGELRALPGGEAVPVVAVSGFPEHMLERGGGTRVRFDAYLEKPFSSAALLQVVATTLGVPSE